MSSTIQKPEVKKSEFIKLASIHTKAFVADYYGLSEKDITKLAGQCKVSFKKRKEDNFVLVDDTNDDARPAEEANKSNTADTIFEEASKVEEPSNITNTEIEVDKPF
jgi:hypothetical protein